MTNIYWIRHAKPPRLAIVARPRGDSELKEDLTALKRGGIDVVVSLLTTQDEHELGLAREREIANELGLQYVSYPIPDGTTPSDVKSFRQIILELVDAIRSGKKVGAHCRGCIGRATVTTASVLIELGWDADDALKLIQQARGWPVPDTVEQRNWIRRYATEASTR
jgi:protein-tyrosine phosphatase